MYLVSFKIEQTIVERNDALGNIELNCIEHRRRLYVERSRDENTLSFGSFTYEILWVRLLDHVLGGSVYAFATMLASFLLGIALGSASPRGRRGA
jgi:hypothetical protein